MRTSQFKYPRRGAAFLTRPAHVARSRCWSCSVRQRTPVVSLSGSPTSPSGGRRRRLAPSLRPERRLIALLQRVQIKFNVRL
ncbi:hypothetical protein EVAR_83426_1 [Eumeta japonica]|uniref:Uncharacterized protein n=1 Tax=Eumeta variegata TaxID=151549 RepID=A0A4C1TYF9_EUMVA|nr:hypothetical protein EVAR_83426_1 [Eumeta japonica]